MISKLARVNGVLKIDIDGEMYEPLSFKSFRPTAKNISDFHKAGVKLYSILTSGLYSILGVPYSLYGESWVGDKQYDFDAIDRQIELFRENAPGCYFALMIQLDTREWWLKTHENFPNSFTHLSQMASNEEWRQAAADYLQAVITHVEQKYGDIIYGYFLLCGTTTEWFSEKDYEASHPFKETYYKHYTGNPEATIPVEEELVLPRDVSFNMNANVKLYRKAHAEQTTDTILYFADKAQQILQHKKLLGLYFGYLFELDGARVWNTAHLAYEKVFFSDDIDMISSPSSYAYRGIDSTSAFMLTYKTLDIHNKLYYLEFDHITHLAPESIEGIMIPGGDSKCKNQTETLNLMRRDYMLCVANGAALWWFDMFEGWFYSDEMMRNIKDMIDISKFLSNYKHQSVAEIAVIASGEALYGVSKNSNLNTRLLGQQRDGLSRMGAPYDVYTAGDMKNIDLGQYKLFIFLDAFEMDAEQLTMIERMKEQNKTLLWIYAPSYLNGGLETLNEIVCMQVKELEQGANFVDCNAELLTKPHFYIDDEQAVILHKYDNGKSAIAYKKCNTHTSVYSAVGNLSGETLREIAGVAGVHIYSETAPVYINSCVTGVYSFDRVCLTMREEGTYRDLFTGELYQTVDKKLCLAPNEMAARLLMKVGEK